MAFILRVSVVVCCILITTTAKSPAELNITSIFDVIYGDTVNKFNKGIVLTARRIVQNRSRREFSNYGYMIKPPPQKKRRSRRWITRKRKEKYLVKKWITNSTEMDHLPHPVALISYYENNTNPNVKFNEYDYEYDYEEYEAYDEKGNRNYIDYGEIREILVLTTSTTSTSTTTTTIPPSTSSSSTTTTAKTTSTTTTTTTTTTISSTTTPITTTTVNVTRAIDHNDESSSTTTTTPPTPIEAPKVAALYKKKIRPKHLVFDACVRQRFVHPISTLGAKYGLKYYTLRRSYSVIRPNTTIYYKVEYVVGEDTKAALQAFMYARKLAVMNIYYSDRQKEVHLIESPYKPYWTIIILDVPANLSDIDLKFLQQQIPIACKRIRQELFNPYL
jgi:hypothetical protein